MKRHDHPAAKPVPDDVGAALAAMSADQLREVIVDMLLDLNEKDHSRALTALMQRAARNRSGWVPTPLRDHEVAEVLAFVKSAERLGQANPMDVDAYLQRGSSAFLQANYPAAHQILGALLRPISVGDIDLGQHEMLDEVLGADTVECAVQYVVSAYFISPLEKRAAIVQAAIHAIESIRHFWEPIKEMERATVEELPELGKFMHSWRDLISAQKPAAAQKSDRDTREDKWLREVVYRLEGSVGLARLGRATRRAADLRAWCQSLAVVADWKAALAAFEEAAGLVAATDYARGELLDGAALAAQELGHDDLSPWLEHAWRAAPSMLRLRRWLGSAGNRPALCQRAAAALEACPMAAQRQRALLHVLQGDFKSAATLLAAAPGLGWSSSEHPGHLLFPLFASLLCGKREPLLPSLKLLERQGLELEDFAWLAGDGDKPKLKTAELERILRTAAVDAIPPAAGLSAVRAAMREAAARRVTGVTTQRRRRQYGHGAELVALCLACDPSPETACWVASIRTEHRRFMALQGEFDRVLGGL